MGFRPEPTIYNLKWEEGHWLHGLEVRVGCLTIKEWADMMGWLSDDNVTVAQNNDRTVDKFFEKLHSWNLEDPETGQPTPKNKEGVEQHEQPLLREILRSWQQSMSGISVDLGKGSTNGSTSLERSLELGG